MQPEERKSKLSITERSLLRSRRPGPNGRIKKSNEQLDHVKIESDAKRKRLFAPAQVQVPMNHRRDEGHPAMPHPNHGKHFAKDRK